MTIQQSLEAKVEAMKNQLWETLGLDNKSIIFNVSDTAGFGDHVGSGIIECEGDLEEEDWVYDLGMECPEEEYFYVFLVESFMIGNGESDHAGLDDVELIQEILDEDPYVFWRMCEEYADCLSSIDHMIVMNPYYEEESEEDEDEDQAY